jgi:CheY-like chemotaxis protein
MSARVLLVEDEPDIRLIARASLAHAGFVVTTAANGLEALAAVASERPDLIVMDWMMPELDGPDACERLKADPATRDIPILFLTARSDARAHERCMALGALGCIAKPFNPLALGEDIKTLWQQSGGRVAREART